MIEHNDYERKLSEKKNDQGLKEENSILIR